MHIYILILIQVFIIFNVSGYAFNNHSSDVIFTIRKILQHKEYNVYLFSSFVLIILLRFMNGRYEFQVDIIGIIIHDI